MKKIHLWTVLAFLLSTILAESASAAVPGRRALANHLPGVANHLAPVQTLAATNLELAIALPWRNPDALTNLLDELYDPASTNYHQWLNSGQFAERFAPTEEDYQKVIHFAEAHGLKVTHTHVNRVLLNVSGDSTNIEAAFQTKLRVYRHPTENRNFFAPDTAPTVETNVPILCVGGLDNFTIPHRMDGMKLTPLTATSSAVTPLFATNSPVTPLTTSGTSPGGYLMGSDFRHAYVPGVTNTGTGQYIAIVDVGGLYYPLDVYMYQTNAGLSTNIVVTNILTTFTPYWTTPLTGSSTDEGEEVLDIDMAMSMAPGATILNYEGDAHTVFNQIAVDNLAKQMTLSYGFGIDASIIQSFQQFAAQGQSFSQASGDGGADNDGGTGLTGNPYATIVGGTVLSATVAGGAWQSDVTWGGSGGGISGYGLPTWQQGIATVLNKGSTSYRNYPDVAMPAVNIFTIYKNGTVIGATGGTSAASPLWAGFMALVNQQAATFGKSPAGLVNPSIYAVGKNSPATYSSCFHDVTSGNTYNSHNPTRFPAGTGYDLCTGWGTPTGLNTINLLSGVGTNDFMFYPSQGSLTLAPGMTATNVIIQVVALNGSVGSSITWGISGLPAGVTASFGPASTTTSSTLNLTTTNQLAAGAFSLTITGTRAGQSYSSTIILKVIAPTPGTTLVSLPYNRTGIYTDGRSFSGGVDGGGYAFSANLLGPKTIWNNSVFNFGPANTLNVVSCSGQVITLPAGNYKTLLVLATGVNGNQIAQTFLVTYTDNTTTTFTQSISDWANSQSYSGESIAVSTSYRNFYTGVTTGPTVNIYGYSFTLDATKTVKTITLPSNSNIEVFAMAVATTPVTVPLAAYYNRAGLYLDGTTFPSTGGLDGGGAAYSATLLGGATTINGALFTFGPPNITNITVNLDVIDATGQTITLPPGIYSSVRLLATGVQGSQANQAFVVTYTDTTTGTFTQTLSDWFSPANSGTETNAEIMGHRNSSNGSLDNRTFYLYGYNFKLNPTKTVQSIKLPNNVNVIVAAISLVPNWPPTFTLNPFSTPGIMAGQPCSGTIATNATDLNGDTMTFSKVSGPAWLTIAANGALSGTPLSADVGTNTFVVAAADPGTAVGNATLTIIVTAAPAMVSGLTVQGGTLQLNWSGGIAPYQVQSTTNLANPNWQNVGGPVNTGTLSITPTNSGMYYRIVGQ
ncbi:MAG TPA: protease pro-enzyme activation domain-containing protein [Verrucomicrobiae bacterium]|jgi:subtilase family serine protease